MATPREADRFTASLRCTFQPDALSIASICSRAFSSGVIDKWRKAPWWNVVCARPRSPHRRKGGGWGRGPAGSGGKLGLRRARCEVAQRAERFACDTRPRPTGLLLWRRLLPTARSRSWVSGHRIQRSTIGNLKAGLGFGGDHRISRLRMTPPKGISGDGRVFTSIELASSNRFRACPCLARTLLSRE